MADGSGQALEGLLISLSGPSAKSATPLGVRDSCRILTIPGRSYRIRLHVSAYYPWNTRYMDLVFDQLRAGGNVLRDKDIERLSPLVHEHVNLHGRYYFGVTEAVQRGELRSLRDPRDAIQEV